MTGDLSSPLSSLLSAPKMLLWGWPGEGDKWTRRERSRIVKEGILQSITQIYTRSEFTFFKLSNS